MKKWLFAGTAAVLLSISAAAPAFAEYMSEHRGGTMRLVARSAAGTLDPHINYTLQYWQIYQSMYSGLTGFKKGAGEEGFKVVPNLAEELPTATNDGKTYVFKIRKGIKFSNGEEVTVNDVVASLQRLFKVSSPTSGGFYSVIVGADKCIADPATCTLEGGVVGDEAAGTVTINLTRVDPEFFYKLAVPHAAILPAGTVATDAGSEPIPTTGPYMVSAYDPNKGLTMSRNPHFAVWSEDAMPDGYPDVVQYDFGLTDEAEVTAVQNGEADWMYDQPPTDRLGEIGTKYKDQVYINTLTAWWYAPMNTRIAPFDNVKARQAVNFAIDRKAMVSLFGGPVLAAPVCQVLPAGLPRECSLLPLYQGSGRKMVGARHREGQAAGRRIRHQGPGRDDYRRRQRGIAGNRHISAERVDRDRLQGKCQADLAEHPVHLYSEHQQQGADIAVAMVPGLSGGIELPERAVRLRQFPGRLRFLDQHLRLLRPGCGDQDEGSLCPVRHGSGGCGQDLG